MTNADILLVGATGFTGKLVAEYLLAHPQKGSFKLALGARSHSRLAALQKDLHFGDDVELVVVDVSKQEQVNQAVEGVKVVINTVGPFHIWGSNVVRACVSYGVHYVDITGETHWVAETIREFDYAATKSKSIIIHNAGYDSVPSDIVTYLSALALHKQNPSYEAGETVSYHRFKGGASGGSFATMMSVIEDVPLQKLRKSRKDWALSPIPGKRSPPRRLSSIAPTLPLSYGGFFIMESANRPIVQRTAGLLQLARWQKENTGAAMSSSTSLITYSPEFSYSEFIYSNGRGKWSATLFSVGILLTGMALFLVAPIRWLFKKVMPAPGEGPDKQMRDNGSIEVRAVMHTPQNPNVKVLTNFYGSGDPGYSFTSMVVSEAALTILLAYEDLPPFAHQGGLLTPATGLGMAFVKRLQETGRVKIETKVQGL